MGRLLGITPGQVAQALHDWPTHYNAGVVRPDGFPDLTLGQSVIHPVHTQPSGTNSAPSSTSSKPQRGKSIDPVTAERFIALAQDLIARLG